MEAERTHIHTTGNSIYGDNTGVSLFTATTTITTTIITG